MVCAPLPGVSVFPKQPPAATPPGAVSQTHGFTGTAGRAGDDDRMLNWHLAHPIQHYPAFSLP